MAGIDDFKKMSPEERIKKLKQLEADRRKELAEAEKMIKESEGELANEEKIRQEIPVPQMAAVDINNLFTKEEKEIFAAKRYQSSGPLKDDSGEPAKKQKKEKSLEEEIEDSRVAKLTDEQAASQRQYGAQLAREQPSQLYVMAKEAYSEFRETGMVDTEKMYALDVAIRMKDSESPSGNYKAASEEAQEQFGSVKSIIKYLRGR